jgi:hypothetical protein
LEKQACQFSASGSIEGTIREFAHAGAYDGRPWRSLLPRIEIFKLGSDHSGIVATHIGRLGKHLRSKLDALNSKDPISNTEKQTHETTTKASTHSARSGRLVWCPRTCLEPRSLIASVLQARLRLHPVASIQASVGAAPEGAAFWIGRSFAVDRACATSERYSSGC